MRSALLNAYSLCLANALAIAITATGAHADESCAPFTVYTDHDTHKRTYTDHGKTGPSVGDQRINTMALRDAVGEDIGDLIVQSTIVDVDAAGNAAVVGDGTIRLPNGVIVFKVVSTVPARRVGDTAESLRPPPEADRIILGGAGAFAGVSGTIEVGHDAAVSEFTLNIACK